MLNCENCTLEHDGSYGSGRFCNSKCARGFSTKAKRTQINQIVSRKLQGYKPVVSFQIGHKFVGRPKLLSLEQTRQFLSPEYRENMSQVLTKHYAQKLQKAAKNWLAGVPFLLSSKGRNLWSLKRMVILIRGNRCENCGWCKIHPITGNVPVQLHHEDGDHSNNAPDNVKLLCPNCHSLTPNYMALNKGATCPGKRYN
jgi:hypothetical protein